MRHPHGGKAARDVFDDGQYVETRTTRCPRTSTVEVLERQHLVRPVRRLWIRQGVQDGVFLLVGSLQPGQGGAVLAHDTTLEDLRNRVAADPFVAHEVVSAEIIEIAPNTTDPRLAFPAA
ncbi:hypothetical protein AB0I68_07255 [Streptomyces sp. NPDC050448]|uniref:YciI family protein n=1 Tax=Streptomyces sp. NPDC050448 TaxID=3155404 RepID=UPI003413FF30